MYLFDKSKLGEPVKAGLEEWNQGHTEIERNASAIEYGNTSWLTDNSLEASHKRYKRNVYHSIYNHSSARIVKPDTIKFKMY